MDDTDFDLLCEGVSPEEAKRLRKILAQWCVGDENSFPVQLALLTRAQWRVAAKVPLFVNQSRQQMGITFADQQQQSQALLGEFLQNTDSRLENMKTTLVAHNETVRKTVGQINASMRDAEMVAEHVERELKNSAREWKEARTDFQKERERLVQIGRDLTTRLKWQKWFCSILFFSFALIIGVLIGERFLR
jgi:hypothetical protein